MLGRKTAARQADPEGPPFPHELAYLWSDFVEVSMGLAQNGMGPAVITWEALAAWCGFMKVTLASWEARALIQLSLKRAEIESETKASGAQDQDRSG